MSREEIVNFILRKDRVQKISINKRQNGWYHSIILPKHDLARYKENVVLLEYVTRLEYVIHGIYRCYYDNIMVLDI